MICCSCAPGVPISCSDLPGMFLRQHEFADLANRQRELRRYDHQGELAKLESLKAPTSIMACVDLRAV